MVSIEDTSDTENIRAGLSRNESLLLSSLSEKGKTILGLKDVTAELKCSYEYAKVLANNLVKKRWLIPIKRGIYLIVPLSAGVRASYTEHEFVIASHLISPYYIAYWSALNFHGLTEQTPFTVFVATTKRAKDREILDNRYHFTTLNKKKFFGFTTITIGTHEVNISDCEKALADALDHPENCGGMVEVAKCLWNAREKASLGKVVRYAVRMGNTAILKRLGYLVESLDMRKDADALGKMRGSISPGISPLDPTMPRRGPHNTRWNLLLNVPREALLSWRRAPC